MKNSVPPRDKYFLRDLHKEIDLYDRKLAYLDKFGEFASPADRELAADKLVSKRATLEKAALQLAASGVEYEESELPRSLRALTPKLDVAHKSLTLAKGSEERL